MNENIIAVNVPNGISIAIMVIVGALVIGLARKALFGSKKTAPVGNGPVFSNG